MNIYGWIKAFHIVAVIAWMAGMLYLPRLFVYHCAAEKGSVQSETFKVMERRLLRGIINPAMIVAIVLGLWLGWMGPDSRYGWFASGWLQAKIVLVLALSAIHGMLARTMPGGSYSRGAGASREAKWIRIRLNWSTQLTPVLGSFTAGEIALRAMSTICNTPNSTSCCKVLEGPRSTVSSSSSRWSGESRSPL